MRRVMWLAICSALIIIALGTTGCDDFTSPPSSRVSSTSQQTTGIWVTGTGEVSVTPDIAILRVGVEAQEKTVAGAQTEASRAMEEVMTALINSGVANEDIQTQYLRIRERTRWDDETDQEIVIGYQVTNKVTAKIRHIEKVSSIIDAVVKAGGDLIRIDDLTFTVDDPSDYYDEAREKAMADAKAKAEKLAASAKVKLGEPTYISESSGVTPTTQITFAEAAPVPAPAPMVPYPSISPGETEISLTVQIAYSIR
jgi:uncharacterized protein YggE